MVKKVFVRHPLPSHSSTVKRTDVLPEDLEETDEDLPEGGNKFVIIIFVILIVLGAGTGYILSRKLNASTSTIDGVTTTVQDGKTSVGSSDTTNFKDSATGTIEEGGLNGEGTHKLIRDGGPSQTVYVISSVVDLDQFIGKKVTVWGQTMAAKKVPWLMDVGRVDVE